jgi:hypothetical protein
MRKAGAAFGVSRKTAATIEQSYAEFLAHLETHLSSTYYVLGGKPTLADYGLMNGLYAHLARDPHPSLIMKRDAPNVFAWTERMNRLPREEHRLSDAPTDLFETIPDSLSAVMQFIADDFLPEVSAHREFTNAWLDAQGELPGDAMERTLGMAEFDWRGHTIKSAVMPYRHWLVQRLTDHYDGCQDEDRIRIREALAEVGLNSLLDDRVSRRVEREGHREVWGQTRT